MRYQRHSYMITEKDPGGMNCRIRTGRGVALRSINAGPMILAVWGCGSAPVPQLSL